MCNGASSRVSQGGTIAILHPTPPAVNAIWPSFPWQTHTFKGELFFQDGEATEGTRAIFRSSNGSSHKDLEDCTVLIQYVLTLIAYGVPTNAFAFPGFDTDYTLLLVYPKEHAPLCGRTWTLI